MSEREYIVIVCTLLLAIVAFGLVLGLQEKRIEKLQVENTVLKLQNETLREAKE